MVAATMAEAAAPRPAQVIEPNCYAQERYFRSKAPVRVFSSRVGRGKSYIACANLWVKACAVPGMQLALTRLERASMENTTLATLRALVPYGVWNSKNGFGWSEGKSWLTLPPIKCDDGRVRASRINVFGWLDPGRHLSAEFGDITVDQAEQLDYKHYTFAQTRLRQNDPWINERAEAMGFTPRQMSLLCNPEDDEHWIAREFDPSSGMREVRDAEGRLVADVILSSFHDNEENLPPDYRERLESLRGTVYYDRLVLGKWARAEGLVFPMWDAAQHLVPKPQEWAAWNGYPPPDWPRYRGIDFGYRNPFVCLWTAVSPEGVHYLYREWSMSERLVEDHATVIRDEEAKELKALRDAPALNNENAPAYQNYLAALHVRDAFADHDAEDAATLARHGVRTRPARKDIAGCIRAIASALNRGTLKIVASSLIAEDRVQAHMKLPTSLPRELSSYRWKKMVEHAKNPSDPGREKPIDAMNHRIDALGYILYSLETTARPSVWSA